MLRGHRSQRDVDHPSHEVPVQQHGLLHNICGTQDHLADAVAPIARQLGRQEGRRALTTVDDLLTRLNLHDRRRRRSQGRQRRTNRGRMRAGAERHCERNTRPKTSRPPELHPSENTGVGANALRKLRSKQTAHQLVIGFDLIVVHPRLRHDHESRSSARNRHGIVATPRCRSKCVGERPISVGRNLSELSHNNASAGIMSARAFDSGARKVNYASSDRSNGHRDCCRRLQRQGRASDVCESPRSRRDNARYGRCVVRVVRADLARSRDRSSDGELCGGRGNRYRKGEAGRYGLLGR